MTVSQKAGFIVLSTYPPLENSNVGVPSLCIPAVTLTDGPNGVANGLTGVTQFPAAIGIGATFNPVVAKSIGQAEAVEARTKGISVVQGPNLNLARVPQSGRIFETYGEDPYLTSVLGVADVNGIQSTGDLANAKHFSAYTQETARLRLNQIVSKRAMVELYDAPFKAAVQQAHVASVMCSYGELNGVNTCSDPSIYSTLKSWGFTGFVRSDLGALASVGQALQAGISQVKPGSTKALIQLVNNLKVSKARLNAAVASILVPMFDFGLIAHPVQGSLLANATSPAHSKTALNAAENSVVLLKNSRSVLPLSTNVTSIAVIGTDAAQTPQTTGGGSSKVQAPYVITPLSGIRSAVGPNVRVAYEPGGPASLDLDQLSDVEVVQGTPLKLVTPVKFSGEPGKADITIEKDPNVTRFVATATTPGSGPGWDKWSLVVRAKQTGTYEVSVQQLGDTWLYLNGREIASSQGLHAPFDMTATMNLVAGRKYTFSSKWFQIRNHPGPKFSLTNVTGEINAAVTAARKATVAIVFASDYNSEGFDRPNLYLPGDSNPLIAAVAAANPNTIVVLNTGGAVLMPWISRVAGVLEAWYPGQEDGAAIAAVLTGAVNPSGHLPIMFPSDSSTLPISSTAQFPGVSQVVNFSEELDIGYRWYQANNVTPQFAFGHGLSYTSFKLSNATVRKIPSGVQVKVTLTNTGTRPGADVVQAYVRFPSSAGEPPEQLRAFARVQLNKAASEVVTLNIASSGFQVFQNGSFSTVPGSYDIGLGDSSASLPVHLSITL